MKLPEQGSTTYLPLESMVSVVMTTGSSTAGSGNMSVALEMVDPTMRSHNLPTQNECFAGEVNSTLNPYQHEHIESTGMLGVGKKERESAQLNASSFHLSKIRLLQYITNVL